MRESIVPITTNYTEQTNMSSNSLHSISNSASMSSGVAPFFSMRKLRLIYNELTGTESFEFSNFDDFKHQVLNSVAPQLELNKWQAIAARR